MSKSKQKVKEMNIPTDNLCNKCPKHIRGSCCYFISDITEIIDKNTIHLKFPLKNHPCKYLNTKTGRCKIYKKRQEINPNCLTIKEMIICGTLTKECLYVKDNQEYQKRIDTVSLFFPNILPENARRNAQKRYEEINNSPHSEVVTYDTLRTYICPQCESPNLKEEWEDKFSILYFSYQCENCGYKWNNLRKQIKYSLKKLKEVD